ncbi:molybdate ABC transporter substrate-binding protein [Planktothrix agardhii 1033]|nr:molybdate ABC transporter substrate-binding protein [Planktothrix agardhii 1033]
MPKRILYFLIGLVFAVLLSVGACSPSATPPQATKTITPAVTSQTTTLLTAAAASLQNAIEEINPLFKSANSEVELKYNFAASGLLQQQIEQGAPVDVNSVRNVLSAVESGNADAGIVYLTDAKISKQVKQVATAAKDLHSPIIYPIAVIKASQNQESAKTYIQFLTSNPAQDVFKKYGFGIAN